MKNFTFLVAFSIYPLIGISQSEVTTASLDINNVGISLSNGGVFCSQPTSTVIQQ